MKDAAVVLTGGVGGAKLVLGLDHAGIGGPITAIVNTGDDFRHLGLHVSPDIDTLLYTLSGKANAAQGWGREGESWAFMDAVKSLGGPDWFNLGDGDLALHVMRTQALHDGLPLSAITDRFARAWGIRPMILPMSDQPVATMVATEIGILPFQNYFVEHRCAPAVRSIRFEGAPAARPAPGVVEAILDRRNRAIIVAPSNPFLSIAPILAVPGIVDALRGARAPVIAVSPLVGGQAVKGPTAKIMAELGLACDVHAIAAQYAGVIDAMVIDERDPPGDPDLPVVRIDTLMVTLDDRIRVAKSALALADEL